MKTLKKTYLGVVLFFMYAPILVLMLFSFNDSSARNYWGGFTLRWYRELFNSPDIMRALRTTLIIGVLSTIASVTIGTLAAMSVDKLGKRKRKAIMTVSKLPVMMPDIITGITLLILFQFFFRVTGFGRLGFGTLLLAHIIFNVPYVILSVLPRLRQLDPNLYEAALDLGASPMRAFMQVILPEIWPGVITGALLAFTLSIDDFMVSFFTTSPAVQNLSIHIFSMTRRGVNPMINALSTLIFIVIMLMLFFVNTRDKQLMRRKNEG